jgi:hypothetical protein
LEQFLSRYPAGAILTTEDYQAELEKRLPEEYVVLKTTDYFLKNKRIVLFGPQTRPLARDASESREH